MSLLSVENLRIDYGRTPAVVDLSLHVEEGEAVALIGPNGAGKTSTLAAITGLVKPADGRITFLGASLAGQAPEDITRRGIALVPEGRHIFGSLTVAENLQLGALVRPNREETQARIDDMLSRFPILRLYANDPAGRLSGGEQQQLAIARALLSQPRLLLLDEPSLGLAPLLVKEVFGILKALRDEGTTILLVEQNAVKAVAFAERTYVLKSGRLALSGTRAELRNRRDLAETYLG